MINNIKGAIFIFIFLNYASTFYLLKSTFRFLCTKTDGISNAQKIINTWTNQFGLILERQNS